MSNSSLCVFSHVILTAPNEDTAEVYQSQLELLRNNSASLQHIQFYCVSDPEGCRVGSGGGTLNSLDYLVKVLGIADIMDAKILMIHSGGDSRRAPLYSVCGKAWITINAVAGDGVVASPVLLLINEVSTFCQHLCKGALVIASSDVLLHITANNDGPMEFAPDAVSVVCVPEVLAVAANHVSVRKSMK